MWAALAAACAGDSPASQAEPGGPLPDLAVRVPKGWEAPINFDKTAQEIGVAWGNRGSEMAEDYSIVLLADGAVAFEWHKPLLAPGSERKETIRLGDLPDPYSLAQGPHKLELILDPDGAVADRDRENNYFAIVREFGFDLPDLRPGIPAGSGWREPVVVGESGFVFGRKMDASDRGYFLAYGVSNDGTKPAGWWQQQNTVSLDGYSIRPRLFHLEADAAPSPNHVQIHAVPAWRLATLGEPLTIGEHRIEIGVDADNSVIEANESNNRLAISIDFPPSRIRTTRDQPDESGASVHPVYALPADARDEEWDINGVIEGIVAETQSWLRQRTGGRGIRWDEFDGSLDITFVRLARTGGDPIGFRNWWQPVVEDLHSRGLDDPKKIYAVWYAFVHEGVVPPVCGVQTEYQGVRYAITLFKRVSNGPNECVDQPVTMVHELFHAFGAVPQCARNYYNDSGAGGTAHVDDDPNDLLYAGHRLGVPIELDAGGDDYFNHDIEGCTDTADSPYLDRPK